MSFLRVGGVVIMNAVDWLFLAGFALALAAMLVFSKVLRAVAWECLRHPFTPARIEVDGHQVRVLRPPAEHSPDAASEKTTPGVR
jgi:hypothetical protein